jgi:hypothetical protein
MEDIKLIVKENCEFNSIEIEIYDFNWSKQFKNENDRINKIIPFFEAIEYYYKKPNLKIREIVIKTQLRNIHYHLLSLLKESNFNLDQCLPFEAQILIPYRANDVNAFRKDQMTRFLTHMFKIHPKVNYKLIILEQNNNLLFNRGLLLNIGFLECEKTVSHYIKYYIHHNVDLFPQIEFGLDYSYTPIGQVKDLFGYKGGLGGICIFNRHDFKNVNGFPNNCIVWGSEDVILKQRCERNNIEIIRTKFYNKRITEETHSRDSSFNEINMKKNKNDNINWIKNGLSTLQSFDSSRQGTLQSFDSLRQDTCKYSRKINVDSKFNSENIIHYLLDFN